MSPPYAFYEYTVGTGLYNHAVKFLYDYYSWCLNLKSTSGFVKLPSERTL
jgi:hypothetical protein